MKTKCEQEKPIMKAWSVVDEDAFEQYVYIVFAETRGKAIMYALQHSDGAFDWSEWNDMRARREKRLDAYYRGRQMLDWSDPEDRVTMVKYAGMYCSDDYDVEDMCPTCPAREWCSRWESMNDE